MKNFVTSTGEMAKVLESLDTMYHYGKEFKTFPETYLNLIMNRGMGGSCSFLHPGRGCLPYHSLKVRSYLSNAIKISIAVTLPTVIRHGKDLMKTDEIGSKARKGLLIKFMRSFMYLTAFACSPAMLMCMVSRSGFAFNRFTMTSCLGLGALIAFFFEPPTRHIQLISFMLPKAIEGVARLLESRGWYKEKD